ncbi:hypothetical protein B0G76_2589 [Paraburkholderia sp. BL23I1N1]|nr:hypothetical protein B0G76_2589 [Paraburkholderia sp. BL23I1N1]
MNPAAPAMGARIVFLSNRGFFPLSQRNCRIAWLQALRSGYAEIVRVAVHAP